jgi:predicted RNase H-like nuclease
VERAFRTFIGVDLGGGRGKSTAVARLSLDQATGTLRVEEVSTKRGVNGNATPFYDDALLAYITEWQDDALLAMNVPLTLPACVRCTEPVCPGMERCEDPAIVWFRTEGARLMAQMVDEGVIEPPDRPRKPNLTPYTQRATEVWLRRHGVLPRETLGQGMGPLTARARHLVRVLAPHFALNRNLIEVYPKATLSFLFSPEVARGYKRDAPAYETRQKILHTIPELVFGPRTGMQREHCFANDHCFDALMCAYTGYLWARDGWTMPERDRQVWEVDGWTWTPPPR